MPFEVAFQSGRICFLIVAVLAGASKNWPNFEVDLQARSISLAGFCHVFTYQNQQTPLRSKYCLQASLDCTAGDPLVCCQSEGAAVTEWSLAFFDQEPHALQTCQTALTSRTSILTGAAIMLTRDSHEAAGLQPSSMTNCAWMFRNLSSNIRPGQQLQLAVQASTDSLFKVLRRLPDGHAVLEASSKDGGLSQPRGPAVK